MEFALLVPIPRRCPNVVHRNLLSKAFSHRFTDKIQCISGDAFYRSNKFLEHRCLRKGHSH
jgi:hypothetical protein